MRAPMTAKCAPPNELAERSLALYWLWDFHAQHMKAQVDAAWQSRLYHEMMDADDDWACWRAMADVNLRELGRKDSYDH